MANILIVDDNAVNRSLLVALLGAGNSLREAGDGEEALALVAAEPVDLMVADIVMPAMDGYELVRRLRSDPKTARTPVILCTAHFQEHETKGLAEQCGVEYVLVKPLDLEAVQKAVTACLQYAGRGPDARLADDFDLQHQRLLLNKLKEKTDKLTVNARMEELFGAALVPLASAGDPRRLMESLCEPARHLMNARFALVGLVSLRGEVSEALAVAGMDHQAYSRFDQLRETHLAVAALLPNPRDGGPRTARLRNPGGSPAAFGFPPDYPRFDSILAAAIVSPTRTYGWLILFHKLDAEEFSLEEERCAGILGALTGRIYEDGSLHASDCKHAEEMERELAARKRAEAETREAVARLNLALNASRTGIWAWDAVSDRMVWDENIHAMCGVSPGTFQGTFEDSAAVVHPEDRSATVSELQRCTPKHPDCAMAFRVVWPDASIHYLDTNGRAFYDESGRLTRMLGTTRDVTDRQELEERLRQAQKMEAVGQLAGGIAHDFNNMLNVILGYSDLLLAKALPGDPVYRRAAEIRKAGQHAAALTQQLLAFSRKKVLKPRVLNLANVLAPMELMLRSTLGAHIEIVTAVDEHLGHVRIDPNQMQQVFMNLAVNARDAMPRGGKLRFEFKNATLDESMAKAHAAPAGSYVTLAVSDNGSGMTAEVQKRIFEPFFTTKKVGQGTGLGLANVYGILQQSGGHIRLHSELGVGTTFQLFFPTVEQPADPAPRESPDSALTGEGTVLVVEDNTGLRALTEEILSSAGYKVLVAEDGDSALSLARDYSGSIQLLLTDIILPKMSGQEIATRLAALRPEIEVLFTSGYNRDATAHIGALDPRANFIQKPWSPQGLCEEVHALLNA